MLPTLWFRYVTCDWAKEEGCFHSVLWRLWQSLCCCGVFVFHSFRLWNPVGFLHVVPGRRFWWNLRGLWPVYLWAFPPGVWQCGCGTASEKTKGNLCITAPRDFCSGGFQVAPIPLGCQCYFCIQHRARAML